MNDNALSAFGATQPRASMNSCCVRKRWRATSNRGCGRLGAASANVARPFKRQRLAFLPPSNRISARMLPEIWWRVIGMHVDPVRWCVVRRVCRAWDIFVTTCSARGPPVAPLPQWGGLWPTLRAAMPNARLCGKCLSKPTPRAFMPGVFSLRLIDEAVRDDAVSLVEWLYGQRGIIRAAERRDGPCKIASCARPRTVDSRDIIGRVLTSLAAQHGARRTLAWCLGLPCIDDGGGGGDSNNSDNEEVHIGSARQSVLVLHERRYASHLVAAAACSGSIDVVHAMCTVMSAQIGSRRLPHNRQSTSGSTGETPAQACMRFVRKAARVALRGGDIELARALVARYGRSVIDVESGIENYLRDADRPFDSEGVEWLVDVVGCRGDADDFATAVERGATVTQLTRLRTRGWAWNANATLAAAACGRDKVLAWLTVECNPPCDWHASTIDAAHHASDNRAAIWIWEHGCYCWRHAEQHNSVSDQINQTNSSATVCDGERKGNGEPSVGGNGGVDLFVDSDDDVKQKCNCWADLCMSLLVSGYLR